MSTTERLRILLVAEAVGGTRGGQERSIAESAIALARGGHDVLVAAASGAEAPEGCRTVSLPRGRGGRAARCRRLLDEAEALVASLRGERRVLAMIPVSGAHAYLPRSGLYPEVFAQTNAARRSAVSRRLARVTARFDRKRRLLLAREAALLRDPAGPTLVALSENVMTSAALRYGIVPPRVRLVRNAVLVERVRERAAGAERAALRRELGLDDDEVVFAIAAHDFRRKGVREVLRAAELLPAHPAWRIVVAGRGKPLRTSLERCRWLGGEVDAVRVFVAADVVVNASLFDPASRVVLEALALGRPVLASRLDGSSEIVGSAGVVVDDPRDASALAAAMAGFLDAERRRACERAARAHGAELDVSRHAREIAALLAEGAS